MLFAVKNLCGGGNRFHSSPASGRKTGGGWLSFGKGKVFLALALLVVHSLVADEPRRCGVKVGFLHLPGVQEVDGNGKYSGFCYDFLQHLAVFGLFDYQFLGYHDTWEQTLQNLREGKIDVICCAAKLPEREAEFIFSEQPIGSFLLHISACAQHPKVIPGDYAHWNGVKVGVLKDTFRRAAFQQFAKRHGDFRYEVVEFVWREEMGKALREGRIDLLIDTVFGTEEGEVDLSYLDAIPCYFMMLKDNILLKERMDYAMHQLNLVSPFLASTLPVQILWPVCFGAAPVQP